MSNRTAEANKAIRLAWEKEQVLVAEGKGTRNWSLEQQKDILERGKAHDIDGKAYEGQHMKSVAEYPQFQGDPDNIQLLSHQEHFEAHKGSWQNSTNWYYDPVAKSYHDFGDKKYSPCKIIELSNPIIKNNTTNATNESKVHAEIQNNTSSYSSPKNQVKSSSWEKQGPSYHQLGTKPKINFFHRCAQKMKDKCNTFINLHPKASETIDFVCKVATVTIPIIVHEAVSKHNEKNSQMNTVSNSFEYSTQSVEKNEVESTIIEKNSSSFDECPEHETRASPKKHSVKGYTRTMNGKDISVDGYQRGIDK